MKYERFEDLPVWQAAADVGARILVWTDQKWFRGKGDLANQLQRATLSISNNIAEGFELGSTNELLRHLYIARGSAGEVRSMLSVMERILKLEQNPLITDLGQFEAEIADHKASCEVISRQLRGWANSLQNSDIEGPRHLTDKSKQAFQQRQKRNEVQQRLDTANAELRRKLELESIKREQKGSEG